MKIFLRSLLLVICTLFSTIAARAQTTTFTYSGYIDNVYGDAAMFGWAVGQSDTASITTDATGHFDATIGGNGLYFFDTGPTNANTSTGDSIYFTGIGPGDIFGNMKFTDSSGKALSSDAWEVRDFDPSIWAGISWGNSFGGIYGETGGYTASVPLVQTEILQVQAKSAVPSGTFLDPNASGGAETFLRSTAPRASSPAQRRAMELAPTSMLQHRVSSSPTPFR